MRQCLRPGGGRQPLHRQAVSYYQVELNPVLGFPFFPLSFCLVLPCYCSKVPSSCFRIITFTFCLNYRVLFISLSLSTFVDPNGGRLRSTLLSFRSIFVEEGRDVFLVG